MEDAELVQRAVAAVAAAYDKTLDLSVVGEPVFGVVLEVYFDGDVSQLAPYTFAVTRRQADLCARQGDMYELWLADPDDGGTVDLQEPDVRHDPDVRGPCELLLERIEATGDFELLDRYFMELGRRLHASLGVPVVVTSDDAPLETPERVQLLTQLTLAEIEAWTANGWLESDPLDALFETLDVVLEERTGFGRAAAVVRHHGRLYGQTGLFHDPRFGQPLTRPVHELDDDPATLAGVLPPGAVAVAVQDLFDVWHDAAVSEGAWLCVLPHEARGETPPIVFRDVEGRAVALHADPDGSTVVLEAYIDANPDPSRVAKWQEQWVAEARDALVRTPLTPLWPRGLPGPPSLSHWSVSTPEFPLDTLFLTRAAVHVKVEDRDYVDDLIATARDELEQRLRERGSRAAARLVIEANERQIDGTIDAEPTKFALIAAGGRWAAAGHVDGCAVTVAGDGGPPPRLDLDRCAPETLPPNLGR